MNQNKKKTLIVLSVLISALLIALTVFSATLAKFVAMGSDTSSARVAKWGISFASGSDLANSYVEKEDENKEKIKIVQSGIADSNLVVPGTKGSLAWVSVKGKPETRYDIDVSCENIVDGEGKVLSNGFSLGNGFLASERLIRDEKMLPVEYFPIIIKLCAFDFVAKTETYHIYAIQREDIVLEECYNYRTDVKNLVADGSNFASYYADETEISVEAEFHLAPDVNTLVNDINTGLAGLFDENGNSPNTDIHKIYSVEWDWIYQPVSEAKNANNEIVKLNTYQTDDMDVALCEAIAKSANKDLFQISLRMGLTVSQANT